MRVTLTVAKDAKGVFSVPYVGSDTAKALAVMARLPADTEAAVIRNARPYARHNVATPRLSLAPSAPTGVTAPADAETEVDETAAAVQAPAPVTRPTNKNKLN